LLQEVVENPAKDRIVRLRDNWVTFTPDQYDATMDVRTNPAIGRGSDMDRLNTLMIIKQTQEMIMDKFGITNILVTPIEYRNTMSDVCGIANIKNVDRYFKPITQESMALAAKAEAEKPPAPEQIIANAEIEKIRADTAKTLGNLKETQRKTDLDEDFRRDKLETDAAVELAKAGITTDHAQAVTEIREANQTERLGMEMARDAVLGERDRTHQGEMLDRKNEFAAEQTDVGNLVAGQGKMTDLASKAAERGDNFAEAAKGRQFQAAQSALDRSASAIQAKMKAKPVGPA
jgi:hypothetical protein